MQKVRWTPPLRRITTYRFRTNVFTRSSASARKTIVAAEKTGNELQFRYSLDGDGTVPRDLAEMDGLPKTFVEESHGGLVKNRSVLSTLERLLEGKPPRTLAERDRHVSSVLFETVAVEVVSEEKLRARPMPQVDETAGVQDLAEEFLGAPSRPAPAAGRVLSVAAAPEIRMIGGYPANLILQATENWEKAAPLREKGQAAVEDGKAFQAESDVRRPIYAKRKVSQLIQIAAETAGVVSMPASLERVVAMAERNPAEAIDALLNERVLNEAEEFLSVLFVKRAAIVNKSVGRIVARGTRQGFGTGFPRRAGCADHQPSCPGHSFGCAERGGAIRLRAERPLQAAEFGDVRVPAG
ncbi:hypothetical protein [uncultured Roseibium sp.]|uniref:hypothetical protein n=1 Tax=uncultured Roseibium sp. TaxID=1936171 RepID=UPI0032174893